MSKYLIFNKSVQGASHKKHNNMECQDASAAGQDEQGRYSWAVVCDGHGDPSCFRSSRGSQFAADCAESALKSLAESFLKEHGCDINSSECETAVKESREEKKFDPDCCEHTIRKLMRSWYERIRRDLVESPLTPEEELKAQNIHTSAAKDISYIQEKKHIRLCDEKWWTNSASDVSESGQAESDDIENIYNACKLCARFYGTTMIAALRINAINRLILLQQGDGRCDVFYEDGTIRQPIPWDDNCFENVTTSLCDEGAAEEFRYCVIDTANGRIVGSSSDMNKDDSDVLANCGIERSVVACYLGTDGVEDSYLNNDDTEHQEGTHVFWCGLSRRLLEFYEKYGQPDACRRHFEAALEDYLSDFSADGNKDGVSFGSGDDVSVAGIVDVGLLAKQSDGFASRIKDYELRQKIVQIDKKIVSVNWLLDKLELARKKNNQADLGNIIERNIEALKKLKTLKTDRENLEKEMSVSADIKTQRDCSADGSYLNDNGCQGTGAREIADLLGSDAGNKQEQSDPAINDRIETVENVSNCSPSLQEPDVINQHNGVGSQELKGQDSARGDGQLSNPASEDIDGQNMQVSSDVKSESAQSVNTEGEERKMSACETKKLPWSVPGTASRSTVFVVLAAALGLALFAAAANNRW